MRITCKTKDTLPLDALTEFQGGLKKRDDSDFEKIRKSIEKYGFATPFFVWTHGSTNHVLDGHGRLETLKRMQADGEEIPPLPVVYVDCKSEADAKNLLLRINSTYGKMTAETIMYGWKNGSHKFYGALNNSTVFDDRINPDKMTKAELLEYVKKLEAQNPTDVIYEKKPARNADHPTMKPVNLLAQLICNSSKADDVILDPFGGSGSTLIAAEKCGRIARLAEVDPHYCDVIRRRWTKWAKLNGREVGAGGLE